MSNSAIATDLIVKALTNDVDDLLNYITEVLRPNETLTLIEQKRVQKQIMKARVVRDELTLMLHRIHMADSRQLPMFNNLTPDMFGFNPETDGKDGQKGDSNG